MNNSSQTCCIIYVGISELGHFRNDWDISNRFLIKAKQHRFHEGCVYLRTRGENSLCDGRNIYFHVSSMYQHALSIKSISNWLSNLILVFKVCKSTWDFQAGSARWDQVQSVCSLKVLEHKFIIQLQTPLPKTNLDTFLFPRTKLLMKSQDPRHFRLLRSN